MQAFEIEKIWDGVLSALKTTVSSGTFTTFLKPTFLEEIKEIEDRLVCTIAVGSAMAKSSLDLRYRGQICMELERLTGKKCEIVFKVQDIKIKKQREEGLGPLFEERRSGEDVWIKAKLRSEYTFENYAVGGSNQMAFAAAQSVSRHPGTSYNPLFIYGGVGVGKTHLMQGVGRVLLDKGEDRVLFCTSEQFTNDLVEGIRNKSTDRVRTKYRKLKLLMIDDVQFMAGKGSAQEEFFHTFNSIQADGGQIIVTSDKPPADIPKLEARLKSRFGAGLVVEIAQPDFELRSAILLIKAKQKGIDLAMDVAQMIAEHVEGVRELEGFLIKAKTEAENLRTDINLDLVGRILKVKDDEKGAKKLVSPNEIINLVGSYYGVGVQQLKGERRTKSIAWARQIAMYLLREEMKMAQEEVGRIMGGRDHTTVLHAENKVKTTLGLDMALRSQLAEIRKRMLTAS